MTSEEIDKSEKGVFRLKKYSFLLRNVEFTTTKGYKIEKPAQNLTNESVKQENKLYINLLSPAECTSFFEDLTEKNLKASSLVYYYFVYGKSPTGEELNFNDLVKYIKDICLKNDDTKNLVNCFKVIVEGSNYKVIVTSYLLIKYLNADKLFKVYMNYNNNYSYNNWFDNGKGMMYGKGMFDNSMMYDNRNYNYKGFNNKGFNNKGFSNNEKGKGKGLNTKGDYKGGYGKGNKGYF